MPDKTKTEYPHEAYGKAYYQCLANEAGRNAASHRWRMRWLDEMLDIKPGDRVVDMGSGSGQIAEHLAERGATVDAVDQEKEAVAFARKRCGHLRQVRFHLCDARNCSHLQSSAYDKAACCDLIEHVYDDVMLGIFREALRLLKPGGVLYVYSPNARHWIERLKARNFILKQPAGHIRVRCIKEVIEALKSCGFEIARIARFPSMLPIVRYFEWLWIRLPFYPQIAIYRISLLARKPSG